jgi:hypothetical protein
MFKKGMRRVPGSGRMKGQKNSRPSWLTVREQCEKRGIEPINELIDLFYDSEDREQKERIITTLAKFCYVQPKQIEHTGSIAHMRTVQIILPSNGTEALDTPQVPALAASVNDIVDESESQALIPANSLERKGK